MARRSVHELECDELGHCSYQNWYEQFSTITLKSVFVPIPQTIIDYLLDEIIILPKECYGENDQSFCTGNNATVEDDELNVPVVRFPSS